MCACVSMRCNQEFLVDWRDLCCVDDPKYRDSAEQHDNSLLVYKLVAIVTQT
jgi:hypothetical protein